MVIKKRFEVHVHIALILSHIEYYLSTWLNAWYIEDDTCIARGEDTYATAICCKIETDSPSLSPTSNPTPPTLSPTPFPTLKGAEIILETTAKPTGSPTIKIDAEVPGDVGITTTMDEDTNILDTDTSGDVNSLWTTIFALIALIVLLLIVIVAILSVLFKQKRKVADLRKNLDSQTLIYNEEGGHVMMTGTITPGQEPGTNGNVTKKRTETLQSPSFPALPEEQLVTNASPGFTLNDEEEKDIDADAESEREETDELYHVDDDAIITTKGNTYMEEQDLLMDDGVVSTENVSIADDD